jgi:purine catabolism regulator
MATLGDLHRAIFPAARFVGAVPAGDRLDRDVAWVRVLRARVPAFDALDATDLALIPGPSLAVVASGGPGHVEELAVALARARVPAVLLVEGEEGDDALDALGAAAVDAGSTVLRMPRTDPVALERSVIGFLVNRRAELERRAAELDAQLARLALLERGVDALAGAIATFLRRPVVIEGRRGDPLAMHVPVEDGTVTSYLSDRRAALRVPIAPAPGEPGFEGSLVLLGEEPLDELARIVADRVAPLLALELGREAAARAGAADARRADRLPASGPPWVVLVARQLGDADRADRAAREETRAHLALLAPPDRLALRGTADSLEVRAVAATTSDDPDGRLIAERVASFLGRTVALSRPFSEVLERPPAEASARATLEAAATMKAPPRVALASRLPAYLLLGTLHNLPDGRRQARELLAPLLAGRPAVQQARVATLRAVLESPSLGEAAARLGVHRNTIAYRVARLERMGGWDLSDPDLRFALLLAARLVHDDQVT